MRATRAIGCAEATRLVSAGLDRELPAPARATLHLHVMGCTACKRFVDQMQLLRRALRALNAGDDEQPVPTAAAAAPGHERPADASPPPTPNKPTDPDPRP